MKKVAIDKVYLLTRIYQSAEFNNKVIGAYLEPVFTEFDSWNYIENLNKIINLNENNAEDLLKIIEKDNNDTYTDGTFVKVVENEGIRAFELAEDSEEALFLTEVHNTLMNQIGQRNEL